MRSLVQFLTFVLFLGLGSGFACPVVSPIDLLGGFAEIACVTLRDLPEIAVEAGLENLMPSIARGEGHAGNLHFAWHLDKQPGTLHTRNPNESYATMELWLALKLAALKIKIEHPGGFELVVGDISREHGGKLKPHFSHQHGRDVDLRFFQRGFEQIDEEGHYPYVTPGLENIDTERLWAFLEALYDSQLVSVVLMDSRIQKILYDAVKSTVPPERLDAILSYPKGKSRNSSMVRHAKNHYSHCHVRVHAQFSRLLSLFWSEAKLQEWDRKLDLTRYGRFAVFVASGDTLGSIALKNKVTVEQLMEWNHLSKRSILHPGQKLWISKRLDELDSNSSLSVHLNASQAPSSSAIDPSSAHLESASDSLAQNNLAQMKSTDLSAHLQDPLPEIPKGAKKRIVKIKPGDTLGAIAKKNHVSLEDLMAWNHLTRSSILHPGQEILIYVGGSQKK